MAPNLKFGRPIDWDLVAQVEREIAGLIHEGKIMAKDNLTWISADVTTLKGKALAAWNSVKAAQAEAKTQREAFEKMMTEALRKQGKVPAGQAPIYSYRFGGLSVAFQDEGKVRGGERKAPAAKLTF